VPRIASGLGLSLTFSMIACGGGPALILNTHSACHPVQIIPDPKSNDDQKASMQDAADMWNKLGLTQLTLEPTLHAGQVPIRFEDAPPAFFGVYEDTIGEIVINTVVNERHARARVMAHELGHAYGLFHVDPSKRVSVMNPGNWKVEPTSADNQTLLDTWPDCTQVQTSTAGATGALMRG
jgi:hypothetical protein